MQITKLVMISDTHGHHKDIIVPTGDILIIAGDFLSTGKNRELAEFETWLSVQPHRHKIIVAGNHDFACQNLGKWEVRNQLRSAHYLIDDGVELFGLHFHGSPWQPRFHDWAFNLSTEQERMTKWQCIPEQCDVLITHGPPYGILDTEDGNDHLGCKALRERVFQLKPRIHLFGHVHNGRGMIDQNGTRFINASIVDSTYQYIYKPIVVELGPVQCLSTNEHPDYERISSRINFGLID